MAKIKYTAKENNTIGQHSYYAVPILNGTLTQDELIKEACQNTSYEESMARGIIEEFMKSVQANLLKGFRCQLGKSFLTVYPTLKGSVKDTSTHVAQASDLKASLCRSRLGCTVAISYSDQFEQSVSWQKVDQNGNEITDEDITDDADTDTTTPQPLEP